MTGVRTDHRRGSLRLLVAGAGTLWVLHFAVVYLFAEWQCRPGRTTSSELMGRQVTTVVILVATLVALVAIIAMTGLAIRGTTLGAGATAEAQHRRGEMAWMAWLLAGIFAMATVVVGVTPLFLGPCA